ncbi:MAG TPA: hypothetical protein VN428_16815 [Bryobacteraceae bacterium]|nr:hypothetical protein [Bryobacteraceae bacterium]
MTIDRLRLWAGWTAVVLSTIVISFWAFWGAAEAFHEGWYHRSLWLNLGLTFIQYLSPSLVLLLPVALALRWPRAALPLFFVLAVAVGLFFGEGTGVTLIALPLAALGALFQFGRPEPRRWAWRAVLILPALTALVTGAVPGYRAMTRLDDGNYGARLVEGNGVRLVWAPEGAGWGERHASWDEAVRRCAHLTADGRALSPATVSIWRLPTVDEAVRSMVRHGRHAGGTWDPKRRKTAYRTWPEKETPLWRRYSPVIYWWTATEDGPKRSFRIAFNGYVSSTTKSGWGTVSFRCVCSPERFEGSPTN